VCGGGGVEGITKLWGENLGVFWWPRKTGGKRTNLLGGKSKKGGGGGVNTPAQNFRKKQTPVRVTPTNQGKKNKTTRRGEKT